MPTAPGPHPLGHRNKLFILVQNQRHLYDDDEQTVRLQGLPSKKENMFIWKTSQWAWGLAFATFPRFSLHGRASRCCRRPSLPPGDKWLDGARDGVSQWLGAPMAQAASVKSRGFAASDRGGGSFSDTRLPPLEATQGSQASEDRQWLDEQRYTGQRDRR